MTLPFQLFLVVVLLLCVGVAAFVHAWLAFGVFLAMLVFVIVLSVQCVLDASRVER